MPGPGETVVLNGHGGFAGLQLAPGSGTRLRAQLDLPEDVDGVSLAGDTREATLFSLFPCTIRVNNQVVFDDGGVPVAAGPALIRLLEALKPGPSDTLDIEIRTPPNQITPWFQMRLTTPGLRARFEALDIAWSQLALAEAFAENAAQWALVEHAAKSLPDPLPTEPAALAKALSELAGTLAPLDEAIKRMTVLLIGHSHIDMNWLWTWPDTVEVIRRDFKSVLALMEEFPELTFSHSQAATYEVIRQQEPALFQQVLQRIVQYEEQRAQPWYRCAIPLFRLSFAQAAVCAMIVGFFAGFVSSTFAPLPGLVQKTSDDELSGELFSDLPSAFPGSAVVVMSYDEGDEES